MANDFTWLRQAERRMGIGQGVDKWGETVYARLGNVAFIGQANPYEDQLVITTSQEPDFVSLTNLNPQGTLTSQINSEYR